MKQSPSLVRLYRLILFTFLGLILLYLSFLSGVSTASISADVIEHSYYLKDSLLRNLLFSAAICGAFTAAAGIPAIKEKLRKLETDDLLFRRWRRGLLFAILAAALIWVFSFCGVPRADQKSVLDAALAFRLKDFSSLWDNGYLSKFPHQLGLVWLSYLASFVFGSNNYLAFGVLNALALTLFYKELTDACSLLGMRRSLQLLLLILGILFYPPILYCSFLYGNVMGLAMSMLAIRLELSFFSCRKLRCAVMGAAAIALAVMLKQNYLIFLIGMLILALVKLLQLKDIRLLPLPALIVVFFAIQSVLPVTAARYISGASLDQPVSSWAWVAMGLQDGERAPGWYNHYIIESYDSTDFNSSLQAESARNDIMESLHRFRLDPADALRFFSQKTSSQWNNPTFQGYWVCQVCDTSHVPGNGIYAFLSEQSMQSASVFLDLILFAVLIGSLLYCALCRKKEYYTDSLIFPMIFVGGFIFHLFWEAKGQYTLPYFLLLFPCAVWGYSAAAEYLLSLNRSKSFRPSTESRVIGCFALVTIVVICFLYSGGRLQFITGDNAQYEQHLLSTSAKTLLPDGTYRLSNANGSLLTSEDMKKLKMEENPAEECNIILHNFQGKSTLRFADAYRYLVITGKTSSRRPAVGLRKTSPEKALIWKISSADSTGVYIVSVDGLALTWDPAKQSVYTSEFTGSNTQIWYPIPEE